MAHKATLSPACPDYLETFVGASIPCPESVLLKIDRVLYFRQDSTAWQSFTDIANIASDEATMDLWLATAGDNINTSIFLPSVAEYSAPAVAPPISSSANNRKHVIGAYPSKTWSFLYWNIPVTTALANDMSMSEVITTSFEGNSNSLQGYFVTTDNVLIYFSDPYDNTIPTPIPFQLAYCDDGDVPADATRITKTVNFMTKHGVYERLRGVQLGYNLIAKK